MYPNVRIVLSGLIGKVCIRLIAATEHVKFLILLLLIHNFPPQEEEPMQIKQSTIWKTNLVEL